jgi:hypothetical protein
MVHYRAMVEEFGAPNGLCSSITESKHIVAVKRPYRRSSHCEALGEMLLINQRLDKLAACREVFRERGMLKYSSLDNAVQRLKLLQQDAAAQHHVEDEEEEEDVQMDNDEDEAASGDSNAEDGDAAEAREDENGDASGGEERTDHSYQEQLGDSDDHSVEHLEGHDLAGSTEDGADNSYADVDEDVDDEEDDGEVDGRKADHHVFMARMRRA